jgi:hypothetical protein
MGGYTMAVSGQHVPAAMNRGGTIEVLLETMFFYLVYAEELR